MTTSGEGSVSAVIAGRRVIAVERSPEYYRVAVERCRAAAEGRRADVRMSADVDTSSPIAAPSPEWGDLFATLAP